MIQARRMTENSDPAHHHGTLLVADHQTLGRGRHGRAWETPPGMAVLATLILSRAELPTSSEMIQLSMLASAVPVAVCQGVNTLVPDARIKYPNDIVINGRKLGGILIEAYGGFVLIGFGINCNQALDDLPTDIRMPASSIFLETGRPILREALLQTILHHLYETLKPDNFFSSVRDMNGLCETLGRTICVNLGDQVITGTARAIASDGRLTVDTESGPEAVHSSLVVRTWFPDAGNEQA